MEKHNDKGRVKKKNLIGQATETTPISDYLITTPTN